ncbi:MAG: signal peptidase I [Holosporales bacterium]|jgi:signal peptidase I|nr:signal peptidase I [Holosporales bacterium]
MNKEIIWKNVKEWLWILFGFVVGTSFLYQPFKIPSGSMIPTLLIGDFLIVNKFCYGYSNDSFRIGTFTFPLPKITKRLFGDSLPQRGDVVVFRNEKDDDQNYIKRVIGIPGDKIELKGGIVYINDVPVELREDGEFSNLENDEYVIYKKYIEKLPNGYEHVIIAKFPLGDGRLDNVGPFLVPEGHYFMMGDNRHNSLDSRVMESVGFIPLDRIMGRAECLFFSSSCSLFAVLDWPFSMRFERFFTPIK